MVFDVRDLHQKKARLIFWANFVAQDIAQRFLKAHRLLHVRGLGQMERHNYLPELEWRRYKALVKHKLMRMECL